jgi:hypothetical protein
MHDVVRNVGEEKTVVFSVPDGPLRPSEARCEDLQLGMGTDQFVEGRIRADDDWVSFFLRAQTERESCKS